MKPVYILPFFLVFGLSVYLNSWETSAQQKPEEPPREGLERFTYVSPFVRPDRGVLKLYADAEKLIKLNRYAEAVQNIGKILSNESDYLVPLDDKHRRGSYRSLKRLAEDLLFSLPPEGQELYEVQFGTVAKQELEDSIASGNVSRLADVVHRYFYSQAGQDAAFLLGVTLLDQNKPVPASVYFQRLYEKEELRQRYSPKLEIYYSLALRASGNVNRANDVYNKIRLDQKPEWKQTLIAGEPGSEYMNRMRREEDERRKDDEELRQRPHRADHLVSWAAALMPTTEKPLLDKNKNRWLMPHGNPQRNQYSTLDIGLPLVAPIWQVSLIDNSQTQTLVQLLRLHGKEFSLFDFPLAVPLVVDGVVVTRTIWSLAAFDINTGRKLWSVPCDSFDTILSRLNFAAKEKYDQPKERSEEANRWSVMAETVKARLWGDGVYNSLSSDGKNVFCIEETLDSLAPLDPPTQTAANQTAANQTAANQTAANQTAANQTAANQTADDAALPNPNANLAALAPVRDYQRTVPNRLVAYEARTGRPVWQIGKGTSERPRTAFLGAPLPVGQELYALALTDGEVSVLALDGASGSVLWEQPLCAAAFGYWNPNSPALSPSYADGILICPTPNKSIAAISLTTRSILWGFVYNFDENNFRSDYMLTGKAPLFPKMDSRMDSSIVIEGGFVVYSPRDGNEAFCLSLYDGKQMFGQWSENRMYVACCRKGYAYIVYKDRVCAVQMETGGSKDAAVFQGEEVAGLGYCDGSNYLIPLSSGEIARIDLDKQELAERLPLLGDQRLGNLVPAGSLIVSQSPDDLCMFVAPKDTDDFFSRYKKEPTATILKAALSWQQGDLRKTVNLLRNTGEAGKKALYIATREAMKRDFNQFVDLIGEQNQLASSIKDRGEASRLRIEEFQKSEKSAEAFNECKNMVRYMDGLSVDESMLIPYFQPNNAWRQSTLAWLAGVFRNIKQYKTPEGSEPYADSVKQFVNERNNELRSPLDRWLGQNTQPLPPDEPLDEAGQRIQRNYRTHLYLFGQMEQSEAARLDYVRFLQRCQLWSEAENVLLGAVGESANDERRAAAYGRIVNLYRESPVPQQSAEYLVWLQNRRGGDKIIDGKTAAEYLNSLEKDDLLRQSGQARPRFREGKIEVDIEKTRFGWNNCSRLKRMAAMNPVGVNGANLDIFFAEQNPEKEGERSKRLIMAKDSVGRIRWTVDCSDYYYNLKNEGFDWNEWFNGNTKIVFNGGLLFVSREDSLLALDISAKTPHILWRWTGAADYTGAELQRLQELLGLEKKLPFGRPRSTGKHGFAYWDASTVYYYRDSTLYALDAITGVQRWSRDISKEKNIGTERFFGTKDRLYVLGVGFDGSYPKTTPEIERIPMTILRNIHADRLTPQERRDDKNQILEDFVVNNDNDRLMKLLFEEYCARNRTPREAVVLDPITGDRLPGKKLPLLRMVRSMEQVPNQPEGVPEPRFMIRWSDRNCAVYNIETETYEWINLEHRPTNRPDWQKKLAVIPGRNQFGTLTNDGCLEIFDQRQGRVLFKTNCLLPENPSGNVLRRDELDRFRILSDCDNNYIVFLSAREPQDNGSRPEPGGLKINQTWEIGRWNGWGTQTDPLYRALAYRVLGNGQFGWEKPISVDYSFFWDEFPVKVPLLTFVSRIRHAYPKKLPIEMSWGDIRAYDLRTGRCLVDYRKFGGLDFCMVSWQTFPDQTQFRLQTSAAQLTFRFVGGAYPSEAVQPMRDTDEEKREQRRGALQTMRDLLAENDAASVQAKSELKVLTEKKESSAESSEEKALTSKIETLNRNHQLWNEYIQLESEQLK